MNNMTLENLYELNIALDKQINKIKEEQKKLEEEIKEKKKVCWEEFYDDLLKLSKYSKLLDTNYSINRKEETLGFEVRNGFIVVMSWKHYNCDGKKLNEPKKECYAFRIERDYPFMNLSRSFDYWMPYLEEVIEDWDYYLKETKKNLEEKMIREMKKKIIDTESKQIDLKKEFEKW